jgi:putative membrane protein
MLIVIWLINTLTLLIVDRLLPGFDFSSFYSALITALLLGLVNAIIRPILLFLTLPINLLTLGLFTFVINALMLLLVASIVKGFSIDSFATAFWAAVILWLISFTTNALLHTGDR